MSFKLVSPVRVLACGGRALPKRARRWAGCTWLPSPAWCSVACSSQASHREHSSSESCSSSLVTLTILIVSHSLLCALLVACVAMLHSHGVTVHACSSGSLPSDSTSRAHAVASSRESGLMSVECSWCGRSARAQSLRTGAASALAHAMPPSSGGSSLVLRAGLARLLAAVVPARQPFANGRATTSLKRSGTS